MSDFLLSVRSLFVPEVLWIVIPGLVAIFAFRIEEARRRMNEHIEDTRDRGEFAPTPYLGAATQEARRRLHGGDA